ncbi:MAG: hypothetical protein ACR2NS_11190 [Gemmatimonadaceae bacterium]
MMLAILPGVAALLLATAWAMARVRLTRLTLLPRFLMLVYIMPFTALVGYFFDPGYIWTSTPRQIEVASDPTLIREIITVGLVGVLGFFAGSLAAGVRADARVKISPPIDEARMPLAPYVVGLLLALIFSWLSAPPETILTASYAFGQSDALAAALNFPAAYLVSYVLIAALVIDAERERRPKVGRIKRVGLALTVAYIVIVLQLLRGDRESSGLIAALVCLFLTSPARTRVAKRLAVRRRLRRMIIPLAMMVGIFIALGQARSSLSDVTKVIPAKQLFLLGLSQNTWTAVLWRNLGVAWEHRTGVLQYKMGQTYVDYFLSLPPGVITKVIGYERPEESWRGISWEDPAGVSGGGLHVVIAPFKNFGAYGVLGILFLYGLLVGRLELAHARGSYFARLMWASVFCSGLIWFWYGDMAFIRAIMAALLIYGVYRLTIIKGSNAALAKPPLRAAPLAGPT